VGTFSMNYWGGYLSAVHVSSDNGETWMEASLGRFEIRDIAPTRRIVSSPARAAAAPSCDP